MFWLQALTFFFLFCTNFVFLVCEVYIKVCWRKGDYLQAQESTVMLGQTLSTTFLSSSKKRMLREDIFSGTQHGSGMPGTTPTARTMLWMVAWFEGFRACSRGTREVKNESLDDHTQQRFETKQIVILHIVTEHFRRDRIYRLRTSFCCFGHNFS